MKFTHRELELLSNGILALMKNANSAAKLLGDSMPETLNREIQEHHTELFILHRRLCDALCAEKEEQ